MESLIEAILDQGFALTIEKCRFTPPAIYTVTLSGGGETFEANNPNLTEALAKVWQGIYDRAEG